MSKVNLIYNSKAINLVNGRERSIPLGDLAIKKGGTYIVSFRVDGDYTAWLPRSEIRDNYLEEGGQIITSFEILPLEYADNKTTITLRLNALITTTLPVTQFQGLDNQTPSVNNCLVYDIELVDPNDSSNVLKVIEASFVQVKPEVTDGN